MPDNAPSKAPRRALARTVPARHDDPSTWLRRGEAAQILGTNRDGVRALEKRGVLRPIRDPAGDARFDPDAVNAFAASHPKFGQKLWDDGDLTAAAAKLFDAKVPRREVVQRLRITFARADELYEDWLKGDFPAAVRARQQQRALEAAAARERTRDKKQRRLDDALKTLRTTLARRPGEPDKGGLR